MARHSGQFKAGGDHPRAIDLLERTRQLKLLDLGMLTIIGTISRTARSRQIVTCHCSRCGLFHEIDVSNILSGKTTNCKCQRRVKYDNDSRAYTLGERYDAIYQRCENWKSPEGKNYGERGIQCRMTREQFIRYMLAELPHETYKGVDIDRINNNGHYEAGNLRLATRSENLLNRENTRFVEYRGEKIPAIYLHSRLTKDYPEFNLSEARTTSLARDGVNVEDILSRKARRNQKLMLP